MVLVLVEYGSLLDDCTLGTLTSADIINASNQVPSTHGHVQVKQIHVYVAVSLYPIVLLLRTLNLSIDVAR